MNRKVGIRSYGVYMPQNVITAAELARKSGVPKTVIEEKFGLRQKYKAAHNEHVSDMSVKAAQMALQGIDPESIDVLIYCGSEYKDYYLWPVAALIQERLGLKRAYAFELMALCASMPIALDVSRGLMTVNPGLKRILIVVASKESDLVDYRKESVRFIFGFGDGAAAVLVEGDYPRNEILAAAALTDGSFANDIYVPAGGSCLRPPFHEVKDGDFMVDAPDPDGMKTRLDPISLPNYIKVIEDAVTKSGRCLQEINFLAINFMKRSFYQAILNHFGLGWENTYYLEEYGHIQAADQILIIYEAVKRGLLKDGDLLVLAAAGTGYTWSAAIVRWG